MEHQEVKQEAEVAAQQPAPQQESQGPDLNIQDLVGIKSIIDVATQRGAFKAAEMEAVGKLYNRLTAFVDAVATKKE